MTSGMKNLKMPLSTYVLLLLSMIFLDGCTVLGALIGSSMTSSTTYPIDSLQLDNIKKGTELEISGEYGHKITGTYQGYEKYLQDSSIDLIFVNTGENVLRVRSTDIKAIEVSTYENNDWWKGALIGAFIDGVILYELDRRGSLMW
jgi:hypothetical protein